MKRNQSIVIKEDETLDYLTCALSTDDHFSKEPITLSGCSHSVCKSCLIKENKKRIKCGRCGVVTSRDLRNDKESFQSKKLISSSLGDLYKVIEERMSDLLQKIGSALQVKNERVEVLVNYIQEEIEIRIESIKCQLDNTFEQIKSDLKAIKEDLLESEDEVEMAENKLKKLRTEITDPNTQTETNFYDYQNDLKKLNEKMNQLQANKDQLEYKPSYAIIEGKSLIGGISYINKLKDLNNIHSLRSELLSVEGLSRSQATFRYTLNELSKFKETKERIMSPACNIRDLEWHIRLKNTEIENNKSLSFFVGCKSDAYLNQNSTISANVECRLLHRTDKEKNFLKKLKIHDFSINGDSWGYREFIKHKDLMNPEKGFYNAIDDSITVEVLVTTEGDAIEVV